MSNDYCYWFLCFAPFDANAQSFFGFSEFLTGLALMVLAWTIADVRYHFRVRTTPLPLQKLTFAMVVIIGSLTLLTDLWRAEQWPVLQGNLLSDAKWQAILGGLFLEIFLIWAWFGLIHPPAFGKRNAKRYAEALYRTVLKGSSSELSVIADELAHSAKSLIEFAPNRRELNKNFENENKCNKKTQKLPNVNSYANSILLLIADKRFCREIVGSSPGTALALFREIGEKKKYSIQIGVFARNIVSEALANKDSFLFHEEEGYKTGYIGHYKPLSQTMFSNYQMVEEIGTFLDPDTRDWDAAQLRAYCRIVLITFSDYVDKEFPRHSYALYRAKGYIERAVTPFELSKINWEVNSASDNDVQDRLRIIVEFIKDAIELLEKKKIPEHIYRRTRKKKKDGVGTTFYDHLASMIFEIIFSASAVRSSMDQCWWIQHNLVWCEIFNFNKLSGNVAKIIKFKVCRLIYDEITDMNRHPNFKGASLLGFCLNVMGLTISDEDYYNDSRALQKAILSWTKKNYIWLHSYNPKVAEACLVDGITYDAKKQRLVKTYPAKGMRRESSYYYLELNSPPQDLEMKNEECRTV